MLYCRPDFDAAIDTASYLTSLARSVVGHDDTVAPVTLELSLTPVQLPVDQAVMLGLMVNEALTNAMLHAFPDGRPGRIAVSTAMRASTLVVTVRDDGLGLRQNGRHDGLGLRLIHGLAQSMCGTADIRGDSGTTVTAYIPLDFQDTAPE